jgi:hypothetical protein
MVLFYHIKSTPASELLRKRALATLSVLPLRLKPRQKGNDPTRNIERIQRLKICIDIFNIA